MAAVLSPSAATAGMVSAEDADSTRAGKLSDASRAAFLHSAVVQDLLAYAARCPLPLRDNAGGRPSPSIAGAIELPLWNTDNTVALIDAEDYPLVRRLRWLITADGYAVASDGRHDLVRLHRLILMVGPSQLVDHKDHNKLDNRKANLRPCTKAENQRNQLRKPAATTGVRGVRRAGQFFVATATALGAVRRTKHADLESAAAAARAHRDELHGEFACHASAIDDGACYFSSESAQELGRRAAG